MKGSTGKSSKNGWSGMYFSSSLLNKDLDWFRKEGFQVVEIDCENCPDWRNPHIALQHSLKFPDYYGRNLHALNDCLSDREIAEPGFILVFRNFNL